MRRTVRPFVKEFKNRSPKAATRQTAPVVEHVEPKPVFLNFSEFPPSRENHDDGYEAALKAADAVFGKKIDLSAQNHPAQAADTSQPKPPIGRILPSLIETEAAAEPEPVEKPRKARARRAEQKAEPAVPARRGRPPREKKTEQPNLPVQRPVQKAAVEPKAAAAPRRTRRPIQLRWVLQTELMAGEKWKRRLPEAAR